MSIKAFSLGVFVKAITGFDDTITNIPILASVTKTRMGKIAFSAGTLVAIGFAIIIAVYFSSFLRGITYYPYIAAGLVFALAALIHFDILVHNERVKAEKKIKECMNIERCFTLFGAGFIASIATVVDDIIAYMPLFVRQESAFYAISGIFVTTMAEIFVVIYFADKMAKIKYKEEIASIGLVILGTLILAGVV